MQELKLKPRRARASFSEIHAKIWPLGSAIIQLCDNGTADVDSLLARMKMFKIYSRKDQQGCPQILQSELPHITHMRGIRFKYLLGEAISTVASMFTENSEK